MSDLGGGPLAAAAGRAAGFLARFGADGGHLWSRALTDPDADVFPQRLALDPAQEIVFAATLYGSFEFSGATLTTEPCCARGLVRSFTAEGAPISAALLPAPSDPDASQIVDALVVDADGRQFAAASATHDAVVHRKQLFRVDGAGWTHELVAFTNGSMEPSLVAKDGGVVLLDSCHIYACPFGEPAPSSDNPPNGSDVVAGGYDEGGALNWSSRWGGRGWDYGQAIATTPKGRLVIAGVSSGISDFGSGPLPRDGAAGDTDLFLVDLAIRTATPNSHP